MGITMIIVGCVVLAWAAGILIGAAMAYDKGFKAGESWGYELVAEQRRDYDALDRIRSMM